MSQNHKRFVLNRYTIGTLALLILAASTTLIIKHAHTDAAPAIKPGVGAAVPSQFSFSGVMGWWQGATNQTSMALFHNGDSCFTSVQHYSGTVNANAELQKLQATQSGGGTSTPGAIVPVTLQTKSGTQQYELHQYNLAPPDNTPLLRGLELGYLQLPGSYIKIEGHCDTTDELPATIPALQAIKFND